MFLKVKTCSVPKYFLELKYTLFGGDVWAILCVCEFFLSTGDAEAKLRDRCKARHFERLWSTCTSAFQEYFRGLSRAQKTELINQGVVWGVMVTTAMRSWSRTKSVQTSKSVPKVYQNCTKTVPKLYHKCTVFPKLYQKSTKTLLKCTTTLLHLLYPVQKSMNMCAPCAHFTTNSTTNDNWWHTSLGKTLPPHNLAPTLARNCHKW